MTPEAVDYESFRGDTIDVQVQFPGADLTGGTLRATLRDVLNNDANNTAAQWYQTFSPSNALVCDDPTTGIANIHVPDTVTTTLLPRNYTLDIEYRSADGLTVKTLQATIKISKDGTR